MPFAMKACLQLLKLIEALEIIERLAKHRNDPAYTLQLRQTHAKPIIEKIRKWIAQHKQSAPPDSNLAKAIQYLDSNLDRLSIYIDHSELPMTNNHIERSQRQEVLLRGVTIGCRSEEGFKSTASFMSLIETCRLHRVDPHAYLTYYMTQIKSEQPFLLPHEYRKASQVDRAA